MRRVALTTAVLLTLIIAGGASAYALGTIWLRPGRCTKVHGTKVCARKVKPRTVTVAPSSIGQTFSGNGSQMLAPLTIPANGVTVHWTSQPDSFGNNIFSVSGSSGDHFVDFDNGNSSTSGTSFIPAGTYTFDVTASAAWTLSF